MSVPFLDLGASYRELKHELDEAYQRVMESGWYLLGRELDTFEGEFADYVGAADCAGVASGLDALTLGLRALNVGPGDEVIVPSNTYIATWLAVSAVGATPVAVEPDEQTFNITGDGVATAITSRTAAILPVHLYGRPADVHGIEAVARRHGLPVLYDAAQAHGSRIDGRSIGEFGDLTAWSFYPGKNLGAFADGGAVTSRDARLVARVRRLRNYGSEVKYENLEQGINSRLDELQAAVLSVKLRYLDEWNQRRRQQASHYLESLQGLPIRLPTESDSTDAAWHLFVVRHSNRHRLQVALHQRGVSTLIHYPIPPHRQEAYAEFDSLVLPVADRLAEEVLSLPIGPHLTDENLAWVTTAVVEALADDRNDANEFSHRS
jgi:dTDP-4-amino-4,6-dideoxygalactose transaminase